MRLIKLLGERRGASGRSPADQKAQIEIREFARRLDTELRSGTFGDAVLDAAHGSDGIERHRGPRHEAVEEAAQRRKSLAFRGRGDWELAHILTGQAGSDLAVFDALVLAPGEESRHRAAASALRVGVVDRGLENSSAAKTTLAPVRSSISGTP